MWLCCGLAHAPPPTRLRPRDPDSGLPHPPTHLSGRYDAATRRYDAEKRAERRAALCAELQRDLAPLVRRALRGAAEAQGEAYGAALLALL